MLFSDLFYIFRDELIVLSETPTKPLPSDLNPKMHRHARSLLFLRSLFSAPIPNIRISRPHLKTLTLAPIPPTPFHPIPLLGGRRAFSGEPADYNKEVDEINLKFAEAREEIDAALDSKETVYFNEEAECAKEAVKIVLDMFDGLLGRMSESEGKALQRSMGLKIEQLKAELKQLEED